MAKAGAWTIVGKVALFVGIVSGLVNIFTGLPFPRLLRFYKHILSHIQSTDQFKIESITTSSNIRVNPGDSFSYAFGLPLTARGTTTLPENAKIWTVVEDIFGGLYLQSPPVDIHSDGRWIATNIRPLKEIKEIIFVQVGPEGDRSFRGMVERQEWSRVVDWPPGTVKIAIIDLI
jgi:hypothetical protein